MSNERTHWHVLTPKNWPDPPAEMSVSACVEIEECPRRWALIAAEYPEIWNGRGYPPQLQTASIAGSVVHKALEVITKQFIQVGVPSVESQLAIQVLRQLRGYTRVVEDCIELVLKRFAFNPRALPVIDHARRTLRGQVPMLRARVQSLLARMQLSEGGRSVSTTQYRMSNEPKVRTPLANGTYSELELHAKSIGWKGRIDHLVIRGSKCEITDFKTGLAADSHVFQVRVYAVLWHLDKELNPSSRFVHRLVLAYERKAVEVIPPNEKEIAALALELVARRQAAETALAANPPEARPLPRKCRSCGVRQLCDAYWAGEGLAVSDDGRFGDVELKITERRGPLSWDAVITRSHNWPVNAPALFRVQRNDDFKVGARVRVIDGALTRDPEDATAPIIVTLSAYGEAYRLE